jgi:hypothetical protein
MHEVVYDVKGGYEDWAYGASAEPFNVNMDCLPPNSKYSLDFLQVDESQNRCFIYLVEAGFDKIPHDGTYGNELSVLNRNDSQADLGNISRNILLMKQFFEIMRPFPYLNSLSYDSATSMLQLDFDVRGCFDVSFINATSPVIKSIHRQISEPNYSQNTRSIFVSFSIELDESKIQEEFDLQIDIQCHSSWKEENKQYGEAQTHFFRAITDPEYRASRKGFKYGAINLDNVHIRNINLKKLNNHSIFHKKFDEIEIRYDPHLIVHFSDQFMFNLNFDSTSQETSVSLNASITSKNPSEERDLMEINQLVNQYQTNISLEFLEDSFKKDKSVSLNNDISDFNDEENPERELTDESSQSGFSLSLSDTLFLDSTNFYDLVGKRVVMQFKGVNDMPVLQGSVILPQPPTVKEAKMNETPNKSVDNFESEQDSNNNMSGMRVPTSGVYCSSESPYSSVNLMYDQKEFYFEAIPKIHDKNLMEILVNLDEMKYGNTIYVKGSGTTTELIKSAVNDKSYEGTRSSKTFEILGSKIGILDMNKNIIFECFPEKSSSATKISTGQEVLKALFSKSSEASVSEVSSNDNDKEKSSWFDLKIILVVLALLAISGIIIWLLSFKKNNKDEVELIQDEIEN